MNQGFARQAVGHRPKPSISARGRVRPIYAAVFDFDVADFEEVTRTVRDWIRTHRTVAGFAPDPSKTFFSIDRLVDDGLLAEVAVSSDSRTVAARLMHWEESNPSRGERGDPARSWRIEATVERDDTNAWLAVRSWFTGLDTEYRECAPPRFVKTLWNRTILSDGVNFGAIPWEIETEEDVHLLADIIEDKQRYFPVVLIAEGCPLTIEMFAPKAVGLAHLCYVHEAAIAPIALRLEPGLQMHARSVRTYFPHVEGRPIFAPGIAPWKISEFNYRGSGGPEAFSAWLREDLGHSITRRQLNDPAHRSYEQVRAEAIQQQRAVLASAPAGGDTLARERDLAVEQNELLNVAVQNLQKALDAQNEMQREYVDNEKILEERVQQQYATIQNLEARLLTLRQGLSSKGLPAHSDLSDADIERLIEDGSGHESVADAVIAAEELLSTHSVRIVFSKKAHDGAAKSPFLRPDDVFSSIVRLGFYWDRIRSSGNRAEHVARERLGVDCSWHESETAINQFGDERRVMVNGESITLEKHLKVGKKGDATTSLRIYFGDKNGEILVGHVGRHLTIGSSS